MSVQEAADQVRAGLDDEWVATEVFPAGRVSPRAAGSNGQQAVPIEDQPFVPLQAPVGEPLELDVDETQFGLRVEHVGQPIRREADPAVDVVVRQERVERHERRVGNGVRFARRLGQRFENEGHLADR